MAPSPACHSQSTFGGTALVATYAQHGGWLLTPQQLPANLESWQHDLYTYRRETIELLFQRIMQTCDLTACPAKGLARSGTFVIACVWLYQVLFLDNYRHYRPLAQIKEFIDETRWRIAAGIARTLRLTGLFAPECPMLQVRGSRRKAL